MTVRFDPIIADVKGARKIVPTVLSSMRKSKFKKTLKKDAAKTVKGWQGAKPHFVLLVREGKRQIYIFTLYLRGSKKGIDKWNWLDRGTPAHTIRAKRKPYLVFQPGYVAGSRPYTPGSRRLVSHRGRRFGPYRRKKQVEHPGIKAREWRKVLKEKNKGPFNTQLKAAIKDAVERSGHAIK